MTAWNDLKKEFTFISEEEKKLIEELALKTNSGEITEEEALRIIHKKD